MSVSTLLTETDFLNLPDLPGKQEFRDGELIELPPAKYSHTELVKRITNLLASVQHESRIWVETGFRLRQSRWVQPDVCVIWPDQAKSEGWFQNSPMVAIEVASRGNTPDQLQQKVIDYVQYGAAEVCVIYPKSHTMVVYRPETTLTIPADQDYCCELVRVVFTPEYRTEYE